MRVINFYFVLEQRFACLVDHRALELTEDQGNLTLQQLGPETPIISNPQVRGPAQNRQRGFSSYLG
jgi:hypothetical protein